MNIKIRLFGALVRYSASGEDSFDFYISNSMTIRQLLKTLNISEQEVWMVTVNGSQAQLDDLVKDNDQVMIFEPVLGG